MATSIELLRRLISNAGLDRRPEQIGMLDVIEQAILDPNGNHLVIEAGTGIGKTFAYLIPVIAYNKQVTVSTSSKSLQDQLSKYDLPFLKDNLPDKRFSWATAKGLMNYVCKFNFDKYVSSVERGAIKLSDEEDTAYNTLYFWLAFGNSGIIDDMPFYIPDSVRARITTQKCTDRICTEYGKCYFIKDRYNVSGKDIIIVNHALLCSDIVLRELKSSSIIPYTDLVIIDEAHKLYDAISSVATRSISLSKWTHISSAISDIGLIKRSLVHNATRLLMTIIRKGGSNAGEIIELQSILSSILSLIARANIKNPRFMTYTILIRGLLESLIEDVVWAMRDDVIMFTDDRQSDTLKIYVPIIRNIIEEGIWNKRRIIACSATISDGTHRGLAEWATVNGNTNRSVSTHIFGTSFNYTTNALLYIDGEMPSPLDRSDHYYSALSERILELVMAAGGHAFLLFTSAVSMNEVYSRIHDRIPFTVMKQGDHSSTSIISAFRSEENSVLFALRTFWEGVDIRGEKLGLVVIDKLPFRSPDPIWADRCAKIDTQYGPGSSFEMFSLPDCIISLRQGIGRLLRSKTDRGVIAILDSRIMKMGYGKKIIRSLPPVSITQDIGEVARFFNR